MATPDGAAQEDDPSTSAPSAPHRYRVGCALLPKKVGSVACVIHSSSGGSGAASLPKLQVQRYLTPKMIQTASRAGIDLCQIDSNIPLGEQGVFDAIVHKMRPNKGKPPSVILGALSLTPPLLFHRVGAQPARVHEGTTSGQGNRQCGRHPVFAE
jgi:hypothetical protein